MSRLFLAAIVLGAFSAAASADQIVSSNLAFTNCAGCLDPTSGSSTYDKSTQQFLSFLITWDNVTWSFTDLTSADYRALIGAGHTQMRWDAECIFFTPADGPCGNGLFFHLFLIKGPLDSVKVTEFGDTYGTAIAGGDPATAGGVGFVTDPPVSTPEPATLSLLIAALIVLISLSPAASSVVRGGLRL